jgi:hypothetical protein
MNADVIAAALVVGVLCWMARRFLLARRGRLAPPQPPFASRRHRPF